MRLVTLFAALFFVVPLFPAASGNTTVIDSAGHVWRTGETNQILTTETAFQKAAVHTVCTTEDLSPFQDPTPVYCKHAYLTEQDSSGNVLYATYLGGSSQDGGTAITTDLQGNVYIAGYTYSADFPVTPGAAQSANAGPLTPTVVKPDIFPFGPSYVTAGGDLFVAKFSPTGVLLFSTLIGGSGSDVASLIAVDAEGSVYVSGTTESPDFPLTVGAVTRLSTPSFFVRLNPAGAVLTYSTYFAHSILAFDIDNRGRAYLTGNALGPSAPPAGEPYVTILDMQASAIVRDEDVSDIVPATAGAGVAIATSPSQMLFLAVSPAPLPAVRGSIAPPVRPLGDAYLLVLNADASRVVAETHLSQARFEALLLDSSGNAYAFGEGAGALPTTENQRLASPCSPDGRTFVLESNPAGTILAATYLRQGDGTAVAVTSPGHILIYRTRSSTTVTLDLSAPLAANFGCPENLASHTAAQGIAPGELLVLTGSGLGPRDGVTALADSAGRYPTSLGGVQVLFNSRPAPLLFVQDGEIHAVAPFDLPDLPVIEVRNGSQSAALDVSGSTLDPGIFNVNGQGAIINQDGTVNSPENPATLESVVSIYATGLGTLIDSTRSIRNPLPDGEVTPLPPPYIITELADPLVTFAGVPGTTLWSGSAPGLIAGVTQLNVQLPAALPAGTPLSAIPVKLGLGPNVSPSVFISVKR